MSLFYKIHRLSAQAVLGYAKAEEGERYSFHLSETMTSRCILPGTDVQEANALFYQIMRVLHSRRFPERSDERIYTELADAIFYMDFSGIFDGGQSRKNLDRQKKAESMFRPEGITLDFGTGPYSYLAFERSGSMSRQARLSFIRADLHDEVRRRIMLDMKVSNCQLSKLYAYNGLMLSSGTRIAGSEIEKPGRVIVVENPVFANWAKVITVEGGEIQNGTKNYRRVEDKINRKIKINAFDGEGLISREYAKQIDKLYCGKHIHHSFQIRMPFVKGMLHEMDYKDLLINGGCKTITDIWGVKHPISEVDVILTQSMFKGCGWLSENNMSWDDYWKAFRKYDHALYITGVSKPRPEKFTQLNYQFLATLSMTAEEFRPEDLPLGWDHSPAEDNRHWITKPTEQRYYDLCCDEKSRLAVFAEQGDAKARVLKKNPLFIHEPVFTKQLEDMAQKTLEDYAVGHLLVAGDVRYLSADLLSLVAMLTVDREARTRRNTDYFTTLMVNRLEEIYFYAPQAAYDCDGACTILRNPHIARNEEIRLDSYIPKAHKDNMRNWYLGHLSDVLMVDIHVLAAERLGGADFDGDMVKTIADPIVRRCVERNYKYRLDKFENMGNLPLLYIPSEEPVIRNADDWHDRFITVRDTFSSRVGQICNAAFDRSIIAYDENSDAEERERCRQEAETLAILVGLEIDSAKSGVKPNLDQYLQHKTIRRSSFLKYKKLLDDRRGAAEKRKKIIEETDWGQVSSNVEKLPYYAYMLREHTPKLKSVPAADYELFAFAVNPDWKTELDSNILAAVDSLLKEYTACLSRIRACKAPIKTRKREGDILRILYARGQEERYDADELYAAFSKLEPERVNSIWQELRERSWHLLDQEDRLLFLAELLPEYEVWYELLSDFRAGGYRILGDLICDIDAENSATERKRLHRESNSAAFASMMDAYENKLYAQSYREAVSTACRKLLDGIVNPRLAVRYIVALGKRNLLWDLVPEQIEKEALRVRT